VSSTSGEFWITDLVACTSDSAKKFPYFFQEQNNSRLLQ
jgi:hypothetical protein